MDIIVGIALLYLVVVFVLDFFGVSSTEEEVTEAPVTNSAQEDTNEI